MANNWSGWGTLRGLAIGTEKPAKFGGRALSRLMPDLLPFRSL